MTFRLRRRFDSVKEERTKGEESQMKYHIAENEIKGNERKKKERKKKRGLKPSMMFHLKTK